MTLEQKSSIEFGPWNPGIQSQLPKGVLPFSSLLRPENIFQTLDEVSELSAFTGMQREDVVAFRPERLAVHELLIRISANYAVSDGEVYEDLGFNFRKMAKSIHDLYITPEMPELIGKYNKLREDVFTRVTKELEETLFAPLHIEIDDPSFFQRLLGKKPKKKTAAVISPEQRDVKIIQGWDAELANHPKDSLEYRIYQSFFRIGSALMTKYGRVRGDKDMLTALISNSVCNAYGSLLIGDLIEPIVAEGAKKEGFILLPIQASPVVMNVKGSSAAGKSTLRPLQQKLTHTLGLCWEDFALISPDIWRKYLLDYESLGEHYKYAGVCSGHELKIVDQKLDAYMTQKGNKHAMPHLLIDRFRFDSFTSTSQEKGSNLLTRFGTRVYLFYMITPPHATVERAWKRGERVGRYKSVDDLLHHNVEAFTGMPHIFFTWALNEEKDVHYEFLDNSVAFGETPRTVAFGENGVLHVLDIERLIDIDRFRKVDINADSPGRVYPLVEEMHESKNTEFLKACIERMKKVDVVNYKTGEVAARVENGELMEWCESALEEAVESDDTRAVLLEMFPAVDTKRVNEISEPRFVSLKNQQTLGRSGS